MNKKYKAIHEPIMVEEIIKALNIDDNKIYLDATTGEGGHSDAILEKNDTVKLLCNDRDNIILEKAKIRLNKYKNRIKYFNENFTSLASLVHKSILDGIIVDLGISSFHFDLDKRGFSFNREEALDMRLDSECKYSASDIVNTFPEKELADIIFQYGEERNSRRIARAITDYRKMKSIKLSTQLKDIIYQAIPKKFHPKNIHVATKTFQALRIYINNELENLKKGIDGLVSLVKKNGVICIITFHSLEDRIVKRKFRELSGYAGNRNPYLENLIEKKLIEIITKKPITPSKQEINNNPRARSAKLRIAKKL